MPVERSHDCFLVTGALGCLGAWTVAQLVRGGARVVAFDAHADRRRLRLLLGDAEMAGVDFARGDIADAPRLEDVIDGSGVSHIIHLAAMLHPQFRDDPRRGVAVNALGGVNVFEAAARRRGRIQRIVYASSIAVYDDNTLYGVYKQAEERMAGVYLRDGGVASIGIRPAAVFGAGRDNGLSADPTLAIQAATLGRPFHIRYGGRCHYHYAQDLAQVFIACATSGFDGAGVFDVQGHTLDMPEWVAAIEAAVPAARGSITFDGPGLDLPLDYEDGPLRSVIGAITRTPLAEAVRATRDIFAAAAAAEPGHA